MLQFQATPFSFHSDSANALRRLFPARPGRHIVRGPDRGGEKTAPTLHFSATYEDYLRHLQEDTQPGPGALGVIPGSSAGDDRVEWLALDLDRHPFTDDAVSSLVALLTDLNIPVYASHGSTGRGCHLYVFLEEPMPQADVYRLADLIRRLAALQGINGAEIFPSAATGFGKAIFLPGRGGLADGFGVNPLMDRFGMPLNIIAASHKIERLAALEAIKALLSFVSDIQEPIPSGEARVGGWDEELRRVGPYWAQGRRQNLALGLAGFAVHQGLSERQALKDILGLARATGDEELAERERAVRSTYRQAKAGNLVAFRPWYAQAGVPVPVPGPSSETLLRLGTLVKHFQATPWPGRAGTTDRVVYGSLLRLAAQHGRSHPEGIEVRVSQRALAEQAGVSHKATRQALRRLRLKGLLRSTKNRISTQAGSFILVESPKGTQSYTPPRVCVKEWVPLVDSPDQLSQAILDALDLDLAFSARSGSGLGGSRLGKTLVLTIQALDRVGGAMSRKGLAEALGIKAKALDNRIQRLESFGLVETYSEERAKMIRLVPKWRVKASELVAHDGSFEVAARDRARFAQERVRFHETERYWHRFEQSLTAAKQPAEGGESVPSAREVAQA